MLKISGTAGSSHDIEYSNPNPINSGFNLKPQAISRPVFVDPRGRLQFITFLDQRSCLMYVLKKGFKARQGEIATEQRETNPGNVTFHEILVGS